MASRSCLIRICTVYKSKIAFFPMEPLSNHLLILSCWTLTLTMLEPSILVICKQCRPRSEGSYRSPLIRVCTDCLRKCLTQVQLTLGVSFPLCEYPNIKCQVINIQKGRSQLWIFSTVRVKCSIPTMNSIQFKNGIFLIPILSCFKSKIACGEMV